MIRPVVILDFASISMEFRLGKSEMFTCSNPYFFCWSAKIPSPLTAFHKRYYHFIDIYLGREMSEVRYKVLQAEKFIKELKIYSKL